MSYDDFEDQQETTCCFRSVVEKSKGPFAHNSKALVRNTEMFPGTKMSESELFMNTKVLDSSFQPLTEVLLELLF